jgi:chromate reductase
MNRPVRILGLAGSLRAGSHNQALVRAAARLAGPDVELEVFERLKDVPVFDEDLEADPPAGVIALRAAVDRADAVLLATPEYNQSIPGATKNMIDWISRSEPGLEGKPVALLGATTGPWGTRIAQSQMRHVLVAVGALVMPAPALFVPFVGRHLDADGEVTDPELGERLRALVSALAVWTVRLTGSPGLDVMPTEESTVPS